MVIFCGLWSNKKLISYRSMVILFGLWSNKKLICWAQLFGYEYSFQRTLAMPLYISVNICLLDCGCVLLLWRHLDTGLPNMCMLLISING